MFECYEKLYEGIKGLILDKIACYPNITSGSSEKSIICGEPAISLCSHLVSLVQWTTRLFPVTRDLGSNPLGGTSVKLGFSC